MSRTLYWKPQPREPWSDWRMYSMLVPILVSALGFFVTGIFVFSDIAVIPARATVAPLPTRCYNSAHAGAPGKRASRAAPQGVALWKSE